VTKPIQTRLLDPDLLSAIFRTVEAAFPEEGCGFVFEGPEGALTVVPTINRATQLHRMDPDAYPRDGRDYFEPDMKPWLRAAREGQAPRVIFHSHPNADAYFSETDHGAAVYVESDGTVVERNPGVVHMVVSVIGDPPTTPPTARVARLFEFSEQSRRFERIATYGENGEVELDV